MQGLTHGQRAGGDGGKHISGTVVGNTDTLCLIGEELIPEQACLAGVFFVPAHTGDDAAVGAEGSQAIAQLF